MASTDNYNKTSQEYPLFGHLNDIEPTDAWEESLFQRLNSPKKVQAFRFSSKQDILFLLFFVLLNAFFLLSVSPKKASQDVARSMILKKISHELLVSKE